MLRTGVIRHFPVVTGVGVFKVVVFRRITHLVSDADGDFPMRTTLVIDDDVLSAAKEIATAERKSVGEVISSLARRRIDAGRVPAENQKWHTPPQGVRRVHER